MGTVVFAIALFQPVWGILQHRVYRKTGKTTWWAILHRWVGRITITAAIINGGLGFILTKKYASYSRTGLIAYIVVSSVVWSVFVAVVVLETVGNGKEGGLAMNSRVDSRDSNSVEEKDERRSRTGRQGV